MQNIKKGKNPLKEYLLYFYFCNIKSLLQFSNSKNLKICILIGQICLLKELDLFIQNINQI